MRANSHSSNGSGMVTFKCGVARSSTNRDYVALTQMIQLHPELGITEAVGGSVGPHATMIYRVPEHNLLTTLQIFNEFKARPAQLVTT